MTIEVIKYICIYCGDVSILTELKRKHTTTINYKEFRYIHICPICNSKKFKVMTYIIDN